MTSMTTLPAAVSQYLQAKKNHDSDALLATLTADAVITDEGHQYSGAHTIRAWNDKASTSVQATYQVLDAGTIGERVVVAVSVSGQFPGSPVTLYFLFTVRADRIAALTIIP